MPFSQRYGYKTARETVQLEGIDEALRNGLWNILEIHVWSTVEDSNGIYAGRYISRYSNQDHYLLAMRLWLHYFKEPVDLLGRDWTSVLARIRHFFYTAKWFEVYDFVEFVAENFEQSGFKDSFIDSCNCLLESEVSAYRFVGGVISRVTDRLEIQQIDETLSTADGPVRSHLARALELLSDRTHPDYRNSIKEAISAVESFVILETGSARGTLGQLLKLLEDQIQLHPALKSAFSSLYGYTSDAQGIRHALLDMSILKFEDAKFFLVICSSFINYVKAKAVK